MCTRSLINHSPLRPNPSPFPYTTLFRSPHTTVRIAYSLEYGLDEMEMHADAIHPGERVILVDDLIATRSEEHTSELQSRLHAVCRLLREKRIREGVLGMPVGEFVSEVGI